MNRYYLPLDDSGVKNLKLPLPLNGFSNQNSFTDFTISFWVLYKDNIALGTFMRFEFNTLTMTLREDSANGYTILSTNSGIPPWNTDINLYLRS